MAIWGSVAIYFDVVSSDCEGIERVLKELNELADVEPNAELINTPLAWARNGELHRSRAP